MDLRARNNTSEPNGSTDTIIAALQSKIKIDRETGFKEMLYACASRSESSDFPKFKEFFINICDATREIPPLEDDDVEIFTELFISAIQNQPSPLAGRAFVTFYRFLANKDNYPGNAIIAKRFVYSKSSVTRLAIPAFMNDREYESVAMDYVQFFMKTYPNASVLHFTTSLELIEQINWAFMRNLSNQVKKLTALDGPKDLMGKRTDPFFENQQDYKNEAKFRELEHQMKELRAIVEQNQEQHRIRMNNLNLSNYESLSDQSRNGNFVNNAVFERFIKENTQTIKELKNSVDQLKKSHQNNTDLLNKIEVEAMTTKTFRESAKRDILDLQLRSKPDLGLETMGNNLSLKSQSLMKPELDGNTSREIAQINNTLLSHYNNLTSLNSRVKELAEQGKGFDYKDQLDSIRRMNKEPLDKLAEDVEYVKDFNSSIQRIINKNLEDITNLNRELRLQDLKMNELTGRTTMAEINVTDAHNNIAKIKDSSETLQRTVNELRESIPKVHSKLETLDLIHQHAIKTIESTISNTESQVNLLLVHCELTCSKIMEKHNMDLDLKSVELKQAISSAKDYLENQLSYNTKTINALSDKINNLIAPRLEEFGLRLNRGTSETVQMQNELQEVQEELLKTTKKANQNQIQLAEMLVHLGVKFSDTNELDLAFQDGSFKGADNTTFGIIKNQVKAIHMEIKNMTNKLPLISGHLKNIEKKALGSNADLFPDDLTTLEDIEASLKKVYAQLGTEIDGIQLLSFFVLKLFEFQNKELKNEAWKNARYQEKVNDVLEGNMNKLDKDIGNIINAIQKRLSEDEEFKELGERLRKLEKTADSDREELAKNLDSYINMIKMRCDTLEEDMKVITLGPRAATNTEDKAASDLLNKNTNHALYEIKDRVLKLEMLTSDYAKRFIEPEAAQKAQKIANQFIAIEEKFDSLLFLLRNYKILPNNLIKTSVQTFRDALSKNNFKAGRQKQDFFDELLKIIKHNGELDCEQFYYVVDVFFLIIVDDSANLKKCYDGGLYKYFMMLARKENSKEAVRSCLFKIVSYLSKFGKHKSLLLELTFSKLRYRGIPEIVDPILQYHIQDSTNYAQLHLDSRRAKLEKEADSILDEVDGMHKQVALVYYAICWFFELFIKEILMDDLDIIQLISRLMDIFEKNRLTKHIREITMHTLLRIIRTQRYNLYFSKGSFLTLLVAIAGNRNLPTDINRTAMEMLSILCKISDINHYLLQDDDYNRLNVQGFIRASGANLPQSKTFSNLTGNANSPSTTNRASASNNQTDRGLPELTNARRPSLRSNSFNRAGPQAKDFGTHNLHNSSLRMDESLDKSPRLRDDNYFAFKNNSYMSDYTADDTEAEDRGGRGYAVWNKDRKLDSINIEKIDPDANAPKNRLLELSKRHASNSLEPISRNNSVVSNTTPAKPKYDRGRDNLEAIPSKGNNDYKPNADRWNIDRDLNFNPDYNQRNLKADSDGKSNYYRPGIRPLLGDTSTDYSRNPNQSLQSSLLDPIKLYPKDRENSDKFSQLSSQSNKFETIPSRGVNQNLPQQATSKPDALDRSNQGFGLQNNLSQKINAQQPNQQTTPNNIQVTNQQQPGQQSLLNSKGSLQPANQLQQTVNTQPSVQNSNLQQKLLQEPLANNETQRPLINQQSPGTDLQKPSNPQLNSPQQQLANQPGNTTPQKNFGVQQQASNPQTNQLQNNPLQLQQQSPQQQQLPNSQINQPNQTQQYPNQQQSTPQQQQQLSKGQPTQVNAQQNPLQQQQGQPLQQPPQQQQLPNSQINQPNQTQQMPNQQQQLPNQQQQLPNSQMNQPNQPQQSPNQQQPTPQQLSKGQPNQSNPQQNPLQQQQQSPQQMMNSQNKQPNQPLQNQPQQPEQQPTNLQPNQIPLQQQPQQQNKLPNQSQQNPTQQPNQPQNIPQQQQQLPQNQPQQQPFQPQKSPKEEQKQPINQDSRNPNQIPNNQNNKPNQPNQQEKPDSRGSTVGGGDEENNNIGTVNTGMKPIAMSSGPMSHSFNKSNMKKR